MADTVLFHRDIPSYQRTAITQWLVDEGFDPATIRPTGWLTADGTVRLERFLLDAAGKRYADGNNVACELIEHTPATPPPVFANGPLEQEPGELHVHNGWMFKRLDEGTVRMRNQTTGIEVTFGPNSWCSIVSHVTAAGENYETFNTALDAHMAPG